MYNVTKMDLNFKFHNTVSQFQKLWILWNAGITNTLRKKILDLALTATETVSWATERASGLQKVHCEH